MDGVSKATDIDKEIKEKINDIKIMIEDSVEEETKKLGQYLIDLMKSNSLNGADIEADEEGYSSSYVAMCYEDHYYQRHAFDVIPKYMKYELDQYEIPEELADLANRFYPDYEPDSFADYIAVDKARFFEHQIKEGAMEYAWDEIHCDSDTAEREAIRRGELHIDREWTTFRESDEEDIIIDKAFSGKDDKYTKKYEKLREKLFGYFGTQFVENFIKRIINQLKKHPASENYSDSRAICTAWDEICVDWDSFIDEDAEEDFEDIIKETIFAEYNKLCKPEKMMLWYFNTYKQYSQLEEIFNDTKPESEDVRIDINTTYYGEAEETANVIWRRIMLRARNYTNYRIKAYNYDENSQDTLNEYFGDAVSEWNDKTTNELITAYRDVFEERFPLDPEKNKEILLQCLASDTPWSQDTDLLIAEEPEYEDDDEEEMVDDQDTDGTLSPWERRMSYFFPMIKDKNRIKTTYDDGTPIPNGCKSITLKPEEDLFELRMDVKDPFANELQKVIEGLNWFVVNDDGKIVIVWDNMVPVFGDVHVIANNLEDTAKQVHAMADNFESGKVLKQLTDFEGYDENGVPNNFYENIRLAEEYEKDLKALAERFEQVVKNDAEG